MRETCIVIGLLIMAVALRTSRTAVIRKLGAIILLFASFALFYFISGQSILVGFVGVILWLFLPWIELLTRVRRMKLPMENRLQHVAPPNASFFPNARETQDAMEADGFTHAADCCWDWSGMHQHYRMYLHEETQAIASLSLCEQSDVAFSFVSITTVSADGRLWRTTNYPFAPTLLHPSQHHWNHVPCSRNCFHQIHADHIEFLEAKGVLPSDIADCDPDHLDELVEDEMEEMIAYNVERGIIEYTNESCFRYTKRGLFFLWGQFIKDMIRLC